MAIDTPAKLAIIGAGPIGLEAALYARFLGYDVIIFEQGQVGEHVRRLGHVPLFAPFGENRSPLGLADITAQDEAYQPPSDDAYLSGQQWLEQYLLPLSQTDLLSDHLQTGTRVVRIGKEQVLKTDLACNLAAGDERGDWAFRLLVRDEKGQERIEVADAVLDCSGVLSQPLWCGQGGIPAVGEMKLHDSITYHLPDLLLIDRARFVGQSTLLIGAGLSAATAACWLHELQQDEPNTSFTWITRHEHRPAAGPVARIANDPYPRRDELILRANEIALSGCWHFGTHVERIALEYHRYQVQLSGQIEGERTFDQVLALVGYRPDATLHEELQTNLDAITGGLKNPLRELIQPEDNFYILGSKSFGRQSDFLFADGLTQIQKAFAIIGDRPTLDLYAGGQPQL